MQIGLYFNILHVNVIRDKLNTDTVETGLKILRRRSAQESGNSV